MSYAPVRSSPPPTPSSPPTSRHRSTSSIPKRLRAIRPSQLLLLLGLSALVSLPFIFHHQTSLIPNYFSHKYITTDLSTQHIPVASGGLEPHLNIPLTLEARLSYLLSRPALEQWEAELPSRHGCPFYTYARNTYFFHDGKPEQWERLSAQDVRRYRSKIVDHLRGVEREGGKLVWDKSLEAATPVSERRGLIFTGDEGVCFLPYL